MDKRIPNKELQLIFLAGIFTASIVIANTLASKLFSMPGGLFVTAGVIAYPFTFLVTDIINEVWGKKMASEFVKVGFVASIIMVILYAVGVALPPVAFWPDQEAFELVLGGVPRIVAASMAAYLVSQTVDVHSFDFLKRKVGKGLWLRNIVSTTTSQAIDSVIFLGIAFGGSLTMAEAAKMLLTYMIVKAGITVVLMPLAYVGVYILTGTFKTKGA